MDWLEALLLGILQGLTEFMPVSSSGHLEIGKALLGVEAGESLDFTLVVHGATVLSTLVVFRADILRLFRGLFRFEWNDETRYVSMLLLSMVPVGIVGLFFKDQVEALFDGRLALVGAMLLVTAGLLAFAHRAKPKGRPLGLADALVVGLAQAVAVLPGLSRSGATIATALLLGKDKDEAARFSFLMVLLPILGANLLELLKGDLGAEGSSSGALALGVGFVAAFLSGLLACTWMIGLVRRGKLIYFALYCATVGLAALAWTVWG